jgi:hypothetical protein
VGVALGALRAEGQRRSIAKNQAPGCLKYFKLAQAWTKSLKASCPYLGSFLGIRKLVTQMSKLEAAPHIGSVGGR